MWRKWRSVWLPNFNRMPYGSRDIRDVGSGSTVRAKHQQYSLLDLLSSVLSTSGTRALGSLWIDGRRAFAWHMQGLVANYTMDSLAGVT